MQNNLNNLINLEAVRLLEEVEERRAREIPRLYERRDPFQLPDQDFIKLYRVNKHIMENVIDIVSEYINNDPRRLSALNVTTQVKQIEMFI